MRVLFRTLRLISTRDVPSPRRRVITTKVRVYAGFVASASGKVVAWTRQRRRAMPLDDALFERAVAHTQERISKGELEGEIGHEQAMVAEVAT